VRDSSAGTLDREAESGRQGFYARAQAENLAPLWQVLHGLVTATPTSAAVPAIWEYSRVRPYLIEACRLISTEEAERRVLVLENPGLPGQSRITPSLFAGLQIILPGETAPAHRHVASALRFIIEGKDAYTAVDGERTMMEPGDFVITPSWTWHDHGNESDRPMVWLDGLDMHIVNILSASFRENYPGNVHPVTRPTGSAAAEAGCNMLPLDYAKKSQTSPIFNYPFRVARDALERMSRLRDPHPCHGFKMVYINPLTGGSAMATITTAMQLLPKGFVTERYRSTAGTAFCVVEGSGTVAIGEHHFAFRAHDLFAAPSWHGITMQADEDTLIFSFSDRVTQEKLDIFREQPGSG
jgi:gentisate 1,2-dioxygenase